MLISFTIELYFETISKQTVRRFKALITKPKQSLIICKHNPNILIKHLNRITKQKTRSQLKTTSVETIRFDSLSQHSHRI